jgi:hypothetical protein
VATFSITANQNDAGSSFDPAFGAIEVLSFSAVLGYTFFTGDQYEDAGFIFRQTGIGAGATILTCTITLESQGLTGDPACTGAWWGFAVDRPYPFVEGHSHRVCDHHPRTTASVTDNVPQETPHISPSLVSIAQEIVNRPGFTGDIGFTWRNTGVVQAEYFWIDFAAGSGNPAKLTITWSGGIAPVTPREYDPEPLRLSPYRIYSVE